MDREGEGEEEGVAEGPEGVVPLCVKVLACECVCVGGLGEHTMMMSPWCF